MPTVIELDGGLGNQLFQLALAAELQRRGHNVLLSADRVASSTGVQVGWVDSGIASTRPKRSSVSRLGPAAKFINRLGGPLLVEKSLAFDESILHLPPRRRHRLRGYWQSERYFAGVAPQLRPLMLEGLSGAWTDSGRRLARTMADGESISLHVRRGDYITNPNAAQVHGVLPESYYESALEYMGGPRHVYVFSDDLEWAGSHFSGPRFTVVRRDATVHAAGEIALMAACSGHIIANSSFSWWGAWLGGQEDQTVAPRQWFASEQLNSLDIVPKRWHRL